ncbi:MAG TPA: lipoprotein-releasing system ATP-binding protein LolD [Firmicutes bacterium]|nr:lipoprotein-releasing system ATP-binding protein LolD [Bacillota bacterium]
MEIVRVNKVKKVYQMGELSFTALCGVDLVVRTGEFLALAGPSGSGKTTLLNLIGCLDHPTTGEIFLEEESIANLSPDQLADLRKKKLGFIFQSFNLIPVLTAFENVEYPLIINKVKPAERRKRVSKILSEVGLGDKLTNFPHQLSGGQQQRVSIARALVHQPALVLADEPTANLDSQTGQEIVSLMQQLNQDQGVSFIFATHDQRIIERAARVVNLVDGKIA